MSAFEATSRDESISKKYHDVSPTLAVKLFQLENVYNRFSFSSSLPIDAGCHLNGLLLLSDRDTRLRSSIFSPLSSFYTKIFRAFFHYPYEVIGTLKVGPLSEKTKREDKKGNDIQDEVINSVF